MNNETHLQAKKEKIKNRLKFLLVYVPLLALFGVGQFLVEDRCSLINCEAASWSKIQGIIISKTNSGGSELRLDENPISIDFSNNAGLSESDLLDKTNLEVTYIGAKLEVSSSRHVVYPERILEFDDKNLWIASRDLSNALISSVPSEEILNRFKRVSIGYRDVYEITWDKATEKLQSPIIFVSVLLSLGDKNQEQFGVESEWFIIYLSQSEHSVSYWVDAQAGKILFTR